MVMYKIDRKRVQKSFSRTDPNFVQDEISIYLILFRVMRCGLDGL